MTTYPFKAAGAPKYGDRQGTLGLAIHMTQGTGGINDLNYLAGKPARGVSANYYAQSDGTVWRMLGWDEASGSLHPGDISTKSKAYYRGGILKDVLGDHWGNPNAYAISIEIGGKASDGPTDAQVEGVIAWGLDMRERFPTIRGAFGHADQTDQKPCPGTSANVKAIFEGLGGHGVFTEDTVQSFTLLPGPAASIVVKDAGAKYLRLKDGTTHAIAVGVKRDHCIPVRLLEPIVKGKPKTDEWTLGRLIGDEAAFVLERNCTVTPDVPAAVDCTQSVADAVAADRAKAKVVWP